jgi:hypothetical protein
MYRQRRSPQRLIACACVPSISARAAYRCWNSFVVWSWRADCNASVVDSVLSLLHRAHTGQITALSRRGLAPQAHQPAKPSQIDNETIPFGQPVSRLTGWLRHAVREAEARGVDLRGVIDALRPHTQTLWQGLSTEDRRRFLRHARSPFGWTGTGGDDRQRLLLAGQLPQTPAAIAGSLTPLSADSRICARVSFRAACLPPLSISVSWSPSAWLSST